MAEVLHTSTVRIFGGRDGRTESADGNLDIALKRPASLSATERGTNPEQLFAAGYAACFAGAMSRAARNAGITLGEIVIDSAVSLLKSEADEFDIAVTLDVQSAGDMPDDVLMRLVREGDVICPYSRAVRGNVPVTMLVKGQPV